MKPHPMFGYIADGMQVDKNGNVYVSGGHEGFAIFSPDGEQLELIQPDAGSSESPMAIGDSLEPASGWISSSCSPSGEKIAKPS